ncbi:hypothetical protein TNCV_4650621 [Trichonephila clavipes]|nr:hypothetical protein TNCV_4650621 [Trichonephila clavipes]
MHIRKAEKAISRRTKKARIKNRQLKCRQEDDLADDPSNQDYGSDKRMILQMIKQPKLWLWNVLVKASLRGNRHSESEPRETLTPSMKQNVFYTVRRHLNTSVLAIATAMVQRCLFSNGGHFEHLCDIFTYHLPQHI